MSKLLIITVIYLFLFFAVHLAAPSTPSGSRSPRRMPAAFMEAMRNIDTTPKRVSAVAAAVDEPAAAAPVRVKGIICTQKSTHAHNTHLQMPS